MMSEDTSRRWIPGMWFLTVLALAHFSISSAPAAEPAWKLLEEEAVTLLSRYIRIDTSNPPGDEIKAAAFFKEIFDRENIEARIIESAPGRGNIYARLRGSGSKKTVVLLNHMDVVPAAARFWQEPPFGGAVKDGFIWGRGSQDMKGSAIVELMAVLALKRQNVPLKADVVFLGTADEEAGGAMGAEFLVKNHPELLGNVGLVLNEGGGIRLDRNGLVRYYSIGTIEKTPLWLKLTASGSAGHGSTPRGDSAVNRLVEALTRVIQHRSPIMVVPEVQRYYADIAPMEPPALRKRYEDLRAALRDRDFAEEFVRNYRSRASVTNTIAVTMVQASEKINVIPAQASANVDVRLLPGQDPAEFIETFRRVIADDSIEIEILLSFAPAVSPGSPEALQAIAELAELHDPGAPVVKPLLRGFTDCHFFREKGIPCYGFIPFRTTPMDGSRVHGNDERISVENIRFGVRAMYELVRKLAAE